MVSVLIPSRGNPCRLLRTILRLESLADEAFEVVVRVDVDDVFLDTYREVVKRPYERARPILIWGPSRGYRGFDSYWAECAKEAIGDVFWFFNDYTEVETHHWDTILDTRLCHMFAVASFEQVGADKFIWALPACHRALFECLPEFGEKDFIFDRVAEFYADMSKLGVDSGIKIRKDSGQRVEGTERDETYRYYARQWDSMVAHWKQIARNLQIRTENYAG